MVKKQVTSENAYMGKKPRVRKCHTFPLKGRVWKYFLQFANFLSVQIKSKNYLSNYQPPFLQCTQCSEPLSNVIHFLPLLNSHRWQSSRWGWQRWWTPRKTPSWSVRIRTAFSKSTERSGKSLSLCLHQSSSAWQQHCRYCHHCFQKQA